jgi:hypothetical protein
MCAPAARPVASEPAAVDPARPSAATEHRRFTTEDTESTEKKALMFPAMPLLACRALMDPCAAYKILEVRRTEDLEGWKTGERRFESGCSDRL